jgi:GTP-binding protein
VSSMSDRDPVDDFEIICRELERFSGDDELPPLAGKPRIAAANKIDALDDPARLRKLRAHLKGRGIPLFPISAATGEGVPELLEAMWQRIAASEGSDDAAADQ